MAEKQWYFKFDPATKEFIPGAVFTEEQPDNSTTVDPATSGYIEPTWNGSAWTGTVTREQWVQQQQAQQQSTPDPYQQQISTVANQLLKQNITLSQRVAVLEKEAK
ncbi:hypothetical protein [Fructobacillus ficulneus]|uniref:Uncharacterized protein n=1 Tax=Fructobacillus ficulneus TaxID=157463 RepID=A0A0K8MH10_9LACO|nr:hypothetical protein [Fructobacillus ficulneus]GAO99825.1 hypothetical protein FFIC_241000 [Fructobacillus ficulneus]